LGNLNKQRDFEAWTEYLEAKPWTMFATFTTSKPISLGSARRLMQKVGAKVLRNGECMFWAAERFELGREGYHCHALINTRYSANQIEKWYSAHYGRADVRRYNPLKGAAGYCAKYMTKKTFDYDMLIGGGALELFAIGGTKRKRATP